MPQKRRRNVTPRLTQAPLGLEAWIAAANAIPPDQVSSLLLLPHGGVRPLWLARTNQAEAEREQEIRELQDRTVSWGKAAVDYIFRSDTDPQEPGERLNELVSVHLTLRNIAKLARSRAAFNQVIALPNAPGSHARLLSDKGKLRVEISPFLTMLNGMEADRIRVCPVCEKLFWAGRLDKSACTELCSGALRQRKLRENRQYKKRTRKASVRDRAKLSLYQFLADG
jgi:hypothetical protein